MSLYKRGSTFYYDFWLSNRRFHGDTGAASKREALRIEAVKKQEAALAVKKADGAGGAVLSFKGAASRYFVEVGQHLRGDGVDNLLWSLAWLEKEIGATLPIDRIDNGLVARLVAKRRGEKARNTDRLVSAATVNRSMTEPLRKILRRAHDIWHQPIARIKWRDHMIREPRERVRELRVDEETRLFQVLRPDYHPIVLFAILTGCRLSECVSLRWSDVDFGGRQIVVHGKGGKIAPIPLPPSVRTLLISLKGHHPDSVFTYVAQRTRDGRFFGQRYPITRDGLKTAFRRALPNADIENYRFHDNRHTAATRILRATGNIKLVKELLRHDQITTTNKYAHVTHDDILNAMERAATVSPTESPTETKTGKLKA